jgi:hypothetical protein
LGGLDLLEHGTEPAADGRVARGLEATTQHPAGHDRVRRDPGLDVHDLARQQEHEHEDEQGLGHRREDEREEEQHGEQHVPHELAVCAALDLQHDLSQVDTGRRPDRVDRVAHEAVEYLAAQLRAGAALQPAIEMRRGTQVARRLRSLGRGRRGHSRVGGLDGGQARWHPPSRAPPGRW